MADNKVSIFYALGGNIVRTKNSIPSSDTRPKESDLREGCPLAGDPESVFDRLGIDVSKEKMPELSRQLLLDSKEDPRSWAKYCYIRVVRVDKKRSVFIRDDRGEKELTFPSHLKEKALFILLLKHSEGLSKQEIGQNHSKELSDIYKGLTNRWDEQEQKKVINHLLNESFSDTIKNINKCLKDYPNVNVKKEKRYNRYYITIPRDNIKF